MMMLSLSDWVCQNITHKVCQQSYTSKPTYCGHSQAGISASAFWILPDVAMSEKNHTLTNTALLGKLLSGAQTIL